MGRMNSQQSFDLPLNANGKIEGIVNIGLSPAAINNYGPPQSTYDPIIAQQELEGRYQVIDGVE